MAIRSCDRKNVINYYYYCFCVYNTLLPVSAHTAQKRTAQGWRKRLPTVPTSHQLL